MKYAGHRGAETPFHTVTAARLICHLRNAKSVKDMTNPVVANLMMKQQSKN